MGHFKNDGTKLASGSLVRDNVFYCDYPGERMFSEVSFEINGNVLDKYDDYTHVMCRQFKLKKDKETGYMRSVGQEVPRDATTDAADVLDMVKRFLMDFKPLNKSKLLGLSGTNLSSGSMKTLMLLFLPVLSHMDKDILRLLLPMLRSLYSDPLLLMNYLRLPLSSILPPHSQFKMLDFMIFQLSQLIQLSEPKLLSTIKFQYSPMVISTIHLFLVLNSMSTTFSLTQPFTICMLRILVSPLLESIRFKDKLLTLPI